MTNRLHAMMLSLLLGIPHFVADTRFGKIGAFHRTWLSGVTPDAMCASESEALARGKALARALETSEAHAGR